MTQEEINVEVGDDTPPVTEQAAKHDWPCKVWDFGRQESNGVDHFNPGLVRRTDGLWLLVRRSTPHTEMPFGHNQIWACKLNTDKSPIGGPTLRFPDSTTNEQFEDARAVYWNQQTWISCVNFEWFTNASWTGAHIVLGVFKDQLGRDDVINELSWVPLARRDPEIGTNRGQKGHTYGKHNKNLLWWFIGDKLHCLYTSDPWLVVEFGNSWREQTHHVAEGVTWKYGIVRGGTPPVLVGDRYYSFFHSSLPWRGRFRRYYMGAVAFSSKPPYMPLFWTQEPLLVGSQNDFWKQRKPLVVFPCGAVMEDGKWLVTFGINDLKSGWVEIPHEELQQRLDPISVVPGMALLTDRTEHHSVEPVPYLEDDEEQAPILNGEKSISEILNLPTPGTGSNDFPLGDGATGHSDPVSVPDPWAKGRAALAARRAAGLIKPRNRKRRRKKKIIARETVKA